MRKILLTLLLLSAILTIDAQVKFMGIPVDGDAKSMLTQLKGKGFTELTEKYEMEGMQIPILKGTFNGSEAHIFIATNHKKVYRVYVAYADNVSESQIKINYNNLVNQFNRNTKYLNIDGKEIPQEEDISYEMIVHNKSYDATYFQMSPDDTSIYNQVWFRINEFHGEYYISIYYDNLLNKADGEDL